MKSETIKEIIIGVPNREIFISKQIPFFNILTNANSSKYSSYPISTIILSLLEYVIMEGNLKNRGIPYEEIQQFIRLLLDEMYFKEVTNEEIEGLTEYIFTKLTNNGSAFTYTYYNPVTNETESISIRYLTTKLDRLKGRGSLIYITTEGMEFLLNTKEIADEYKVSVHLLLLQKMIKSNNLEDVLRSIINLNAEIKKQIQQKQDLIEILQYAPENRFNEYVKYKNRVISILNDEDELLLNTKTQINSYEQDLLENISKHELSREKREAVLNQIKRINLELDISLGNHQNLLDETVNLINRIPEIQNNRLRRQFSQSFNFEEKMNNIIKNNNNSSLRYIIEPLLKPNIRKIFNICKIDSMFSFKERQQKTDKRDEYEEVDLGEVKTFENEIDERITDNYTFYMRNLVQYMISNNKADLKEFIGYLKKCHGDMPLNNKDFITFVFSLTPTNKEFYILKYSALVKKTEKSLVEDVYINTIKDNKNVDLNNSEIKIIPMKDTIETININDIMSIFNLKLEFKL